MNYCWVKCELEPGMFPNEYLAVLRDLDGSEVAWYTYTPNVRLESNEALATKASQQNGTTTIILTNSPEIGRRYVRVPSSSIRDN